MTLKKKDARVTVTLNKDIKNNAHFKALFLCKEQLVATCCVSLMKTCIY